MTALLDQLKAWLMAHYPELQADLQPGADALELEALEEALTVKLPAPYSTLLKRHNGQNGEAAGLFGNWELLSVEDVLQEWRLWKDLADHGHFDESHDEAKAIGPVKARWWHPAWVPISADGMGNNHCLDMAPDTGGQLGRVIVLLHDNGERKVLAPSLEEWLATILTKLESGEFALALDDEVQDYFFEPEGFIH